MHLRTLAIALIFSVLFKVIGKQLCEVSILLQDLVDLNISHGLLVVHPNTLFDLLLHSLVHNAELIFQVRG